MDFHDDDMDLSDDDGGVKLEKSPSPSLDVPIKTEEQDLQLVDMQFYEGDPSSSDDFLQNYEMFTVPGGQLWRLPQDPINANRHTLLNIVDSMQGHIYHKSCKLISENWRCEPAEALPDMLHESTPYSLTMLLQLRMLSSCTKQDRDYAHSLLVNQWQGRLDANGVTPDLQARDFRTKHVSGGANPESLKHCEPHIRENVYGLTLGDVGRVLSEAKRHRKQIKDHDPAQLLKKARRQERRQDPEFQRQRAEKIARRRENKEARRLIKREEGLNGIPADVKALSRRAAKRERKEARRMEPRQQIARGELPVRTSKRLAEQRAAAPTMPTELLSLDDVRMQRMADQLDYATGERAAMDNVKLEQPLPDHNAEDPEDAAYTSFCRQNRRAYGEMSSLMRARLHIDDNGNRGPRHEEKVQKRVDKMLETGGRSRNELAILPSERFDIGSMPALYRRLGDAKEQEMAAAMDALELAKMGQQPLPSMAQNTMVPTPEALAQAAPGDTQAFSR